MNPVRNNSYKNSGKNSGEVISYGMKKTLIFFFVLAILLMPVASVYAAPGVDRIVPKCTNDICGYRDITNLVQNIIKFMIYLAVVVATLMFTYAGFIYLTAGGSPDKLKKAHGIFFNVFIGLVLVLAAWLIVELIMTTFLSTDFGTGVWNKLP